MNEEKYLKVKEIDRFKSLNHKNKFVSEFIIYTMVGETSIDAYTLVGYADNIDKYLDEVWAPNIKIKKIPYENK
jgi:hypothetical protein